MKKLLIMLLIVLLGILGYYCIFKSITILNINILSFFEISNRSEQLDLNINQAKSLATVSYQTKLSELESHTKSITQEKEKYEELVKLSTAEEIIQATQSEKYEVEYLWTIIGNHATDEGVIIKMDVVTNNTGADQTYDLSFTVNGSYISITDFMYDLENDSSLEFKIENFSLLPTVDSKTDSKTTTVNTNKLQAKFVVRNLNINMDKATLNSMNSEVVEEVQENTNTTGTEQNSTSANTIQ